MDNNNNNNIIYTNNNIITNLINEEDTNMDLDLNTNPVSTNTPTPNRHGLGLLLDELETAHDHIEERIRRLEAVTARTRQRHFWRLAHNHNNITDHNNNITANIVTNEPKPGQRLKRDSSHLANSDSNSTKGGFFDCNICLDAPKEPILTCCGHLFCWVCFYGVCCVDGTRECPVCRGEVREEGVTPVYGNGKEGEERGSGSVVVPPRPKAHRVESFRQRRVARSATHIPVTEVLRRIRMGISGEDRARIRREIEGDSRGRWRIRTHQFSNVLPDSASSLYSISSALDNAERLVDDLESFVNGGFDGNSRVVDSSGSTSLVEREEVVEPSVVTPSSQIRAFSREIRRRRMG